jgi:hypothetical protein
MKAEDFSARLLAIARLSAAQRVEALAALAKAGEGDGSMDPSRKTDGKRRNREDSLGNDQS